MPEETENSETEQTVETEDSTTESVDETADSAEESADAAQEADEQTAPEKPFDQKKFEAELRKKNSEAKNLRDRLKKLEPLAAELQAIKDAEKSESERLNDQLAAANERVAKTRQRLVRSQVQALAGQATDGRPAFADPADAFGELDLGSYIDSDGDIDEAAIEADLQALLERKPHWARAQPLEGPRRPAPDRTQASGANKPRPLTPADEFASWMKSQLK